MEKMAVYGYGSTTATTANVIVGANCNVTIKDSRILYGAYGLWNDGVHTSVSDSFIWGYDSALISHGANWYHRVKFDQPASSGATYAYVQGTNVAGLTTAENHFIQCDFSIIRRECPFRR